MHRLRLPTLVLTATALLGACRAPSGSAIAPPDSDATARSPNRDAGVAPPPAASSTSPSVAPVGPPPVGRACDVDVDCAVAQVEVSGDAV
ncbi:MAG TPA: hypothetical protein VF316_07485, partial [Polyangiaceae bacterium]